MKKGFDCEKYIDRQYKHILERIEMFNNKLYLEFGGKLFYDYHASRVLPGFDPTAKIKLLEKLKDKLEIIICIYAGDIEQNKIRADFGTSYAIDTMRLIDDLRDINIDVNSVVITRYDHQPSADMFIQKLNRRGIKTYTHKYTKGYPTDVDTIVSEEGYGANAFIQTTKPLVVVTAPGPGSGKLATCLSQVYHEYKNGIEAGYAKFETFPIWNLSLSHPVNVAYEAATVDLEDINLIDSFHLEEYGKTTVNYNRDLEAFPVLQRIFKKITKDIIYKSPTDMGVNMAGYGIIDDDAVKEAAKNEIIRRYFYTKCDYKKGLANKKTVSRAEFLLSEMDLKPENRSVVSPARKAYEKSLNKNLKNPMGLAIALEDGKIVSSSGSFLMNAPAALIINAVKKLARIEDDIHIISPKILEPIVSLKKEKLHDKCPVLDIEEILIALSISTAHDKNAKKAYEKLDMLHSLEAHSSAILSDNDERMMKNLGINITCDAKFVNNNLIY